jgi:hypothetical protein
MLTYLRFTRKEFQAIAQVCRPIELTEGSFRALQPFLVQSLQGLMPDLSNRIDGFRKYQVGILYQYLKERREAGGRWHAPEWALSHEELQALAEACSGLTLQDRFLSYSKDFLVLHFRESSPPLAAKLARLSESQFKTLCERVRGRNRWSA